MPHRSQRPTKVKNYTQEQIVEKYESAKGYGDEEGMAKWRTKMDWKTRAKRAAKSANRKYRDRYSTPTTPALMF